jgi:Fe-S-cluster-containing dehydrogenase component
MSIDRRGFLKVAGTTAGLAAAATSGQAQARPNKTMPEEALGLLFDGTLCIGCRACMPACKQANNMPPELTPLKVGSEEVNAVWDAPLDISGRSTSSRRTEKATARKRISQSTASPSPRSRACTASTLRASRAALCLR